ncbi:GtrA family protein [Caballeronia humi]|uniref:GtrA family protein n=1 Tax=Caballeronia humi TaxID=326474 RepID=UPI000AB0920C|nr:GtrA family protein [Caballeronia humi]
MIRRFVAYGSVGATGTLAQYALLVVLVRYFAIPAPLASMLGAVLGACVNYVLNHRFTFGRTASHRQALPRFLTVAGLGIVVNGTAMIVLVDHAGMNYLLAQVCVTALVLLLTFVLNSVWTFREAPKRSCQIMDK